MVNTAQHLPKPTMHQMLRHKLSSSLLGSPGAEGATARSREISVIRLHNTRKSLLKATCAPDDDLLPLTKGILRPAVLADRPVPGPPSPSAASSPSLHIPCTLRHRREQPMPVRARPRSAPANGRHRLASRRSCALTPEEAGRQQLEQQLPAYGSYFNINQLPGPASYAASSCNVKGDLIAIGATRAARPGSTKLPLGTWSVRLHRNTTSLPLASTLNYSEFGSTGRSGFLEAQKTPGPAGSNPPPPRYHARVRRCKRAKPAVFSKSRRW